MAGDEPFTLSVARKGIFACHTQENGFKYFQHLTPASTPETPTYIDAREFSCLNPEQHSCD
jgi:hypothetical protein